MTSQPHGSDHDRIREEPLTYTGEVARDIAAQADSREPLKGTTPPVEDKDDERIRVAMHLARLGNQLYETPWWRFRKRRRLKQEGAYYFDRWVTP